MSLPDKAGKASESVTLFSDRSAQTTSCVLLSTARCNFRQIRRRSLPCFLTFHSPSPKDLQPGGINHRCAISPGGRFETTLTDFCPLTDTGVIRAATERSSGQNGINKTPRSPQGQNTRLITQNGGDGEIRIALGLFLVMKALPTHTRPESPSSSSQKVREPRLMRELCCRWTRF